MSEPRHSISATEEPAPSALPAAAPRPTERERSEGRGSPHASKFFAVSATLIGVAVGALAVAVLLALSSSRPASQGQWSAWKPPDTGVAGEREIAAAVSPFYRASPAAQLVIVTATNVQSATSSSGSSTGTQIALQDASTGSLSALGGTTAEYNLCGLGPSCAIATGAPSAARMLLLRREALELALYTFKYIGGVDNVVAILPPGKAGQETTGKLTATPPTKSTSASAAKTVNLAVLFQRQSLSHYLSQPLRNTLPEAIAPTVSQMPLAPEAELVSVLTGQTLFQQHTVQSQDGSNVLVLQQIPPQ